MIVQRFYWKVKVGCQDKFVELLKSERDKSSEGHVARFYTPNIGKYDIVAGEFEFENLAELEKFWDTWYAKPETEEYLKKSDELRESSGGTEVWYLE
jgi:hypothetical protein